MVRSKTETYLGFCLRAGKITLGVNAVSTVKKGVYLLLADETVAKNSKKEILKLKEIFHCPLLLTARLETLVKKENCKLAAIRDRSLADAIYGEVGNGQLTEYIGGFEE